MKFMQYHSKLYTNFSFLEWKQSPIIMKMTNLWKRTKHQYDLTGQLPIKHKWLLKYILIEELSLYRFNDAATISSTSRGVELLELFNWVWLNRDCLLRGGEQLLFYALLKFDEGESFLALLIQQLSPYVLL